MGVVQNVHEHAYIERVRFMRNCHPVERFAGNPARRPGSEFDALDRYCGIDLLNQAGNGAVATSDIEHRGSGWDLGGQRLREDTNAPVEDRTLVRQFQER